jgi:NAD(P)-dependent dehydrogenase (short-subunit alcohol dehydrogenase family)
MSEIFDLSGKVAVVTGGNGGIGLGMARGLARAGADLAIWARNAAKSEAARKELEALGVRATSLACDVSQEEDVLRATEQTVSELGRIDVCVANAGFGSAARPLEMSLEEWRKVTQTDLDGSFLTLRTVARHMVERGGGGKLIAISSISAIFGTPLQLHYAAAKAGLEGLVRSLAVSLARHVIQVNAIQPGWIVTDATAPAVENEAFSDVIVKRTPARRWGRPDELEGIAVYLASDASSYHTGDTIRIDGGYAIF